MVMVSPSGMSSRRDELDSSPRGGRGGGLLAAHLSRSNSVLGDDAPHLGLDPLEVLGREGAREAEVVLELLEWSWRPASIGVPGHSRLTASASTCSAE
jgi:hypothetical protein